MNAFDEHSNDAALPTAAAVTTAPASRPTFEMYQELQRAYDFFNRELFGGQLPGAMITLLRKKNMRGHFIHKRYGSRSNQHADEIAMNPIYFGVEPLEETLSTVVHEMVHQWQYHFGKPSRSNYHNREWGTKMDELGLCPSSTERPGGKRTGQSVSHYSVTNGRFITVCRVLITDKFRLTWFDCYPPAKLAKAGIKPFRTYEWAPEDPEKFVKPADEDEEETKEENSEGEPFETHGDTEQGDSTETAVIPQGIVIEDQPKRYDKTPSKYACPVEKCRSAAWGKPKQELGCLIHATKLVETRGGETTMNDDTKKPAEPPEPTDWPD